MVRRMFVGVVALAAAIVMLGCGGGGGAGGGSIGGSGSGNPSSASSMFLTSDKNSSYSHIWVTVMNVGLVSSTGQTTTVYDGSTTGGQVVDLSSLNVNGNQQFLLLSGFSAPNGMYKSATITLGSTLSVVSAGGSTATSATFSGSTGSTITLNTKFSTQQSANGGMVLDFSLGSWSLGGATVTASGGQFVSLGSNIGLANSANILSGDYLGTVSAIAGTSPSETFTVSRGRFAASISTSSSTVLYNSDGSANPTLANGEVVDVAGSFDPMTNAVNATAIIIEVNGQSPPPIRVNGLVTADSASSGTLTLQLAKSHGWLPVTVNLNVDVSSNTTFMDSNGVTDTEAQFFADLTAGTSIVQVEGAVSGSVFTATSAQILPSSTGGNSVIIAARGAASDINTTADSFTLTVDKREGRLLAKNKSISVVTTANTQFAVDGVVQSAATFFATLPASSTVNVRGTIDPTTLVLTAAIVTQGPADGFGFHF